MKNAKNSEIDAGEENGDFPRGKDSDTTHQEQWKEFAMQRLSREAAVRRHGAHPMKLSAESVAILICTMMIAIVLSNLYAP